MENTNTPTPEEIAEARRMVAADDLARMEADRAQRAEYMKPLVDLVNSDAFIEVEAALVAMKRHYNADDWPAQAVSGLVTATLPWLKNIASMSLTRPSE